MKSEKAILGKKRRNGRYRLKHREDIAVYQRDWYEERKERLRIAAKKYQQGIKRTLIAHYSGNTNKCANCGIDDIDVLCLDHINGNGNKHRKAIGVSSGYMFYQWLRREGFPDGFQVLCYNCNMKKRIKGVLKCG